MSQIARDSLWLLVGLLSFVSCSAIKIETGQTQGEAIESSQAQAKMLRASWANRFQQATPPEMARLLIYHVDSVTARYVTYGFGVAAQWREGSANRSDKITDTEIRDGMAQWIETQKPILKAYEDNLEYALERIRQSRYFHQNFLDLLGELAGQYYRVYSVTFSPSGSVEEYEQTLDVAKRDTEMISARCQAELDRY